MTNRLKEFRTARGLTALQLAESVGVRETTIFNYESGKISPPLRVMHMLSSALDASLDELFPAPEPEEASA